MKMANFSTGLLVPSVVPRVIKRQTVISLPKPTQIKDLDLTFAVLNVRGLKTRRTKLSQTHFILHCLTLPACKTLFNCSGVLTHELFY